MAIAGPGSTEAPFPAEHFRLLMPVCVHRLHIVGVLETESDARTVAADIRNTSMPCLQSFCGACRAGPEACRAVEDAVAAKNATYDSGDVSHCMNI